MTTSQNQSVQNSGQNPTNKKAELDHTIKFTHAEDGRIDTTSGNTVFSNLLMFGAFAKTRTHKYDKGRPYSEFATDLKGLEFLEWKSEEIREYLSESIASIAMALAYLDPEVGNKHINNLHWLTAGLADLMSEVSRENSEINHTLRKLSNQANLGEGAK
ncbi:MAG: hypothetical protein ACXWF8_00010 [Methylobacter sp.]